jgi:ABC-type transport system substrate-binding protein
MGARRSARTRALVQLVAVVAAVGCMAAACAGGSDTGSAGPGGTQPLVGSADTTPDVLVDPNATPKDGGSLTVAVDAETEGWDPTQNRWANAAYEVASSIFDPLVMADDSFQAKPYLAESITPNADYTQWDVKLRPNVTFHDGEKLDAHALDVFVKALQRSALTASALKPIKSAAPAPDDPLVERFVMVQPWTAFPYSLMGQAGFVPSPKQLADPVNGPQHPVGTGPFVFDSWTPNNKLVVKKNTHYWRQGLPHLDSVTFQPIPDAQSAYNALKANSVDMMITFEEETGGSLVTDAKAGSLQIVRSEGDNDVNLVMFNLAKPPFDDLRMRQAVAYALDRDSLGQVTGSDPSLNADSVFQKTSKWYVNTNYPTYDPVKAKELIAAYQKEHPGPINVTLGGIPDPYVVKAVQTIAQQWQAVGINVKVDTPEENTFIVNAVSGNFQVQVWRQFGAADPDENYVWWIGANAAPPPNISLNMARNVDPQLDDALNKGRTTPLSDVDARKQAYATVQQRQTADLPYLWLNHLRYTLGANNKVRNIESLELPDGSHRAHVESGWQPVTAMWIAS